jgi:hypothetical protein
MGTNTYSGGAQMYVRGNERECTGWITLTEDSDKLRVLLNTAINHLFP